MALTMRVMVRWHGGSVQRQASDQEREQGRQRLLQILAKWKADPTIRPLCYYTKLGQEHCMVLEVADLAKIQEMDHDVWTAHGLLLEKATMEIVVGDTEVDALLVS